VLFLSPSYFDAVMPVHLKSVVLRCSVDSLENGVCGLESKVRILKRSIGSLRSGSAA
jgi:hypothetical protein